MTGMENSRWVAVSALAAAMFAVGFSFAAVACSSARDVSVAEAARAEDSVSVPAPAASLGSIAKIVNGAPSALPASSAAPGNGDAKASVELKAASDGLKLKRFVVARKIDHHQELAAASIQRQHLELVAGREHAGACHGVADHRIQQFAPGHAFALAVGRLGIIEWGVLVGALARPCRFHARQRIPCSSSAGGRKSRMRCWPSRSA